MSSLEESFSRSLEVCESLLNDERAAIEKSDADSIEAILARKDEAFAQLLKAGEDLPSSPVEKPEFASRFEAMFSAQEQNLELMQLSLAKHTSESSEIREGQARLRMVKGAYLPSTFSGDRTLN
jgi:hypothetical protein